MTSQSIRKIFLNYFKQFDHKIVPSVPIVVKNDPTLMFINAGMNPFKDYFLGNTIAVDKRIANSQKCLRVSGKHNDLEEVGVDTYHHTMFEMLGNWSFGDYFKEDAIKFAWELLTDHLKLDKSRLYVTIFEGDEKEKISKDEDAFKIWEKYIDSDRILLGNKKDNFWEMGEVGPCGPCSEIHYDTRKNEERDIIDGKELVNKDNPFVLEIWNLVFMQFNRKSDNSLELLPNKHVDTGMGFERLVRIIQKKDSNYDTDLFMPIISKTEILSNKKYNFSDTKVDIAFRVIADHIRAISFAIADGQVPSNNGAGYVIRRILRRAVRYGYSFLDLKSPFLYQLVDTLILIFDEYYKELNLQSDFIKNIIKEEEKSFLNTLSNGIKIFNQHKENSNFISGENAFELYDTYGFPFDLTQLMANEEGIKVDEDRFIKELNIQKERSRKVSKIDTEDWIILDEKMSNIGCEFLGYNIYSAEVKIVKYRKFTQKNKVMYQIVTDKTPFYAESGGQIGDSGIFINDSKESITILNTIKENNLILHLTENIIEDMNSSFTVRIDTDKRDLTTKNHSATHLLQASLKKVLGNHVEQKGSLVNDKILRFDFSHNSKLSIEQLSKIENIVNSKIKAKISLKEEIDIDINEAYNRGVTALFGEKYGEKVRIITFEDDFSKELCGGCHVKNTSDIEIFKILSESSISTGIRRIEAITSNQVIENFESKENILSRINNVLKNPNNTLQAVENLLTEISNNKKQLEFYQKYFITNQIQDIESKNNLNTPTIIEIGEQDSNIAKQIATQIRTKHSEIKFGIFYNEKSISKLIVILGNNISGDYSASDIVKSLSSVFVGNGGGQKNQSSMSFVEKPNLVELNKTFLDYFK